jgi:hypothetical protein
MVIIIVKVRESMEVGVMAQDLLMLGFHEAVVCNPVDGYLYVDYDLIDLTLCEN